MADAVGLIVLLLFVVFGAVLVPATEVVPRLWWFIYLVLAVVGWSWWRSAIAPRKLAGWFYLAVFLAVLGALNFALDKAFKLAGDFALTILIFPAVTAIAIAGMARSAYRHWRGLG